MLGYFSTTSCTGVFLLRRKCLSQNWPLEIKFCWLAEFHIPTTIMKSNYWPWLDQAGKPTGIDKPGRGNGRHQAFPSSDVRVDVSLEAVCPLPQVLHRHTDWALRPVVDRTLSSLLVVVGRGGGDKHRSTALKCTERRRRFQQIIFKNVFTSFFLDIGC